MYQFSIVDNRNQNSHMKRINHEEVPNCIILDIGGTLAKLCFVSSNEQTAVPHDSRLTIKLEHNTLYFNYFKYTEDCWKFLRLHFQTNDIFTHIIITGGGAFKYEQELNLIAQQKNKQVVVVQEFESLVGGLSFFRANNKYLEFIQSYISKEEKQSKFQNRITSYSSIQDTPLLVVNIGSGVSLLLVEQNAEGQLQAERVGGTSLGGGFFMGLANLLTGENNFQKLLQMAQKGDVRFTDFTPVDFPQISDELSEASVLVSLGKLNQGSSPNDIVRSLFFMVTFNIAQIALSYSEIKNVKHVVFTGFYCRGNNFFLQCFAEAFHFFGKKSSPRFIYSMVHDGFLGALGAYQMQQSRQKSE